MTMTHHYIGLMSGTSMDAVDAALVTFSRAGAPTVHATHTVPLTPALREQLLAVAHPGPDELDRIMQLDATIARLFAQAVRELLAQSGFPAAHVRAVGSHGQTIRHMPSGAEPYTVQIGNPSLIAELTGITTVADFRRRDMAAGGQGAPLAPGFHTAFFRTETEPRVVLNIGGIANVTLLPQDLSVPVMGFDTGPGNMLLDAWMRLHQGKALDEDGRWARSGQVIPKLLAAALADPYFARRPPKSTGREHFHLDWLRELLVACGPWEAHDVQATLLEITATSIATAIQAHMPAARRVLVCGGGVHNTALLERLQHHLPAQPVLSTATERVDPDFLEAIGFAWLAHQTMNGHPSNLPEVTGAQGPRILGGIYMR